MVHISDIPYDVFVSEILGRIGPSSWANVACVSAEWRRAITQLSAGRRPCWFGPSMKRDPKKKLFNWPEYSIQSTEILAQVIIGRTNCACMRGRFIEGIKRVHDSGQLGPIIDTCFDSIELSTDIIEILVEPEIREVNAMVPSGVAIALDKSYSRYRPSNRFTVAAFYLNGSFADHSMIDDITLRDCLYILKLHDAMTAEKISWLLRVIIKSMPDAVGAVRYVLLIIALHKVVRLPDDEHGNWIREIIGKVAQQDAVGKIILMSIY